MFSLIVFATVCLVSSTVMTASLPEKPFYDLNDADNLFKEYVKEHKKVYGRKEYLERLEIFKETLKDLNSRNALYPKTVFAINRFSDYTPEERKQLLGFRRLNETTVKVTIPDTPVPAPSSLDWRDKGVVSHVKDQGKCGSCYIFSAVGNIEGQYAIKHGQCLALSEGQALDCLDCGSCGGGIMDAVMNEFAESDGVMKEADYPYKDNIHPCHEDPKKVAVHVKSGAELKIPDEDTLMKKLSEIGPLSVALSAADLHGYGGGIVRPHSCTHARIDHGVLLVGYGEEDGEKYWILKNSWGKNWGEKGYFRLLRGVNACKMGTSYTASATVA